MPNWTRNRITMDGLEESRLVRKNEDGVPVVDFEGVIPMPKELRETEQGGFEKEALLLALDTLKDITESERAFGFFPGNGAFSVDKTAVREAEERIGRFDEDRDKIVADGFRYIRNALTYGYLTWYHWSIEQWGTKWNAPEEDTDISDDTAEFDTAWTAPLPVAEKLSELYPDREVCIEWADDSMDSTGCIVYKGGVQVAGGRDEDIEEMKERFEDLWGCEPDLSDEEDEA